MRYNYPEIGEAIAMHDALIHEFGGAMGMRDEGALASALMRPQLGYYDSLIEEAAALMESLANNHPFVDGNKRVAFFVTDAFLRLNGHFIVCDSVEAYEFFMRLFEMNSFRFAQLCPWLEEKVRPSIAI
ncbi:MAG: type II toxin-antitoxin system death-on-curing family toxin [Caldilineaceae bacterium]|nr:type II toxin-antitoxin system death-on-curing family toxin [Caldilineaceae bacterium]MDE0338643.1 type II toxin-antitoxin system death-on-curing family toxin [Caldilineaceae bacterium]